MAGKSPQPLFGDYNSISIHLRSGIGKHLKRVMLQSTPKHIAEVSTDKRQVQEQKISIQAKVVATEAYRNS